MNTFAPEKKLEKERLMWIDWMKAIGIYFIVAGHLFPVGYIYVYSFSVPLFFIVSGFLSKREDSTKLFWKKLWFNLFIPMLIICVVNLFINLALRKVGIYSVLKFPFQFLLGFHSALKCLWFVYTLICLKILLQFTPKNIFVETLLFVALPLMGIWIDLHPIVFGYDIVTRPNALIDTTIAYPFYIIGFYLRRWKNVFKNFNNFTLQIIVLILAITILGVGARFNGEVWMYINGYGNNFSLFLLDGLSGTLAVFIISKWLGKKFGKGVVLISKGTIIILGFHMFLVSFVLCYLPDFSGIEYLYALLITIIFVPIIRFSERYMPYIVGKYRV